MSETKSVYVLLEMSAEYAPVGVYEKLSKAKEALHALDGHGVINHFVLNAMPRNADDIDQIFEIDDLPKTVAE